ncbi:MAG: tRNA glutamyl-Q(34) synthetase GluQRS [Desulfovibrio sp.]
MKVRSRLAPSPTGYMHLGNIWSFLLCWLLVRSKSGTVVLRMEDIDPARSRDEFVQGIIEDFAWLGLDWDEGPACSGEDSLSGPFFQSQRLEEYGRVLKKFQQQGHVYPCFCTRKELRELAGAPHGPDACTVYPGLCRDLTEQECDLKRKNGRNPSLRMRCPQDIVSFQDMLHGEVSLNIDQCGGDFPVRRSDGVFAYQLAVVLDDIAQGITHIVRGDDILHCTPRQVYLYELLGAKVPEYAHIPLVLDHENERLAKRHKSLEVRQLRESGVTADAICGYLAYRAGLIPELKKVAASSLVAGFDICNISLEPVVLPENIQEVLLALD